MAWHRVASFASSNRCIFNCSRLCLSGGPAQCCRGNLDSRPACGCKRRFDFDRVFDSDCKHCYRSERPGCRAFLVSGITPEFIRSQAIDNLCGNHGDRYYTTRAGSVFARRTPVRTPRDNNTHLFSFVEILTGSPVLTTEKDRQGKNISSCEQPCAVEKSD